MRFLPVDLPRNAIGLVFWVAIERVLLWKPGNRGTPTRWNVWKLMNVAAYFKTAHENYSSSNLVTEDFDLKVIY